MGCDIHMYIEYADKNNDDVNRWRDFGKRINPGRNYAMFGILAKVRSDTAFSFEPKGIPKNLAYSSASDSRLFICESDDDRHCTPEQAERWVNNGSSKYIDDRHGKPTWVTHPDWHSHSWLTTDEYKQALEFYNKEYATKYPEPEYQVVLTCLEKFTEMGFDARIVFWFDN
jgi:hypothetical protein